MMFWVIAAALGALGFWQWREHQKGGKVDKSVVAPGRPNASFRKIADEAEALYKSASLANEHENERERFKSAYHKPESQKAYSEVSDKTGVPAPLIAALHWRESGGLFDRYLHNGDPLGKPTTHVPKGKMFDEWEPSAVDALKPFIEAFGAPQTIGEMLAFAEHYNGLGYRKKGIPSPYVWSGTDVYKGGKVAKDGGPIENIRDQQLGVAEMLRVLSLA